MRERTKDGRCAGTGSLLLISVPDSSNMFEQRPAGASASRARRKGQGRLFKTMCGVGIECRVIIRQAGVRYLLDVYNMGVRRSIGGQFEV